jgi:hypothetical protein
MLTQTSFDDILIEQYNLDDKIVSKFDYSDSEYITESTDTEDLEFLNLLNDLD